MKPCFNIWRNINLSVRCFVLSTAGREVFFWDETTGTLLLWGHGDLQYSSVAPSEGGGALRSSTGVIGLGQKLTTGKFDGNLKEGILTALKIRLKIHLLVMFFMVAYICNLYAIWLWQYADNLYSNNIQFDAAFCVNMHLILHVHIKKLLVHMIKLHVDINILHVQVIVLHVDITCNK